MASTNQIIYSILNTNKAGTSSDDSPISKRQIMFWFNEYRSLLLTQEMSKRNTISPSVIQRIKCLPIEVVGLDDCCELPEDSECTAYRTTQKIPSTLTRGQKPTIISVESVDGLRTFSRINSFRRKYSKYNKWSKQREVYWISDGYIYLLSQNPLIENISVSGVWPDPLVIETLTSCSGEPCFTWDDEYPVDNDMIPIIINLIWKEKMNIALNVPADNVNNAKSDINQ